MPQPYEAVVDLLILVPKVRAILVELEIGGVDDAHAGELQETGREIEEETAKASILGGIA